MVIVLEMIFKVIIIIVVYYTDLGGISNNILIFKVIVIYYTDLRGISNSNSTDV